MGKKIRWGVSCKETRNWKCRSPNCIILVQYNWILYNNAHYSSRVSVLLVPRGAADTLLTPRDGFWDGSDSLERPDLGCVRRGFGQQDKPLINKWGIPPRTATPLRGISGTSGPRRLGVSLLAAREGTAGNVFDLQVSDSNTTDCVYVFCVFVSLYVLTW